jgi:7-carboxy-7-deazaguanine synthase
MYKINEIFGPTIQGEGKHTGKLVNFIRFSICNKRCSFCDTDFDAYTEKSIADIIDSLKELNSQAGIIVMTGGEPLLQVDPALLVALKEEGYQLHVETNGSLKLGDTKDLFDHVSVSPKQNLEDTLIEKADDIKFLWPSIMDSQPWEFKLKYPDAQIGLQPIDGINYKENLKNTIIKLSEHGDYKLSIQLHKVIGVQ